MTTAATGLGQEPIEIEEREAGTDDLRLWSVTTIIDVLESEGLTFWACGQAAEAAIDGERVWKAMLETQGRDEALKWVRDARFRRPKGKLKNTDLGTVGHELLRQYGLTGAKPGRDVAEDLVVRKAGTQADIDGEVNLLGRMLNQFDGWAQRAQPAYRATEVCVYSPTYGYAGQADAFATVDLGDGGGATRLLLDYKFRREPYTKDGKPQHPYPDSDALQLAGYRNAEFAAVFRPRRYNDQWRRRYYCLSPTERELAVPIANTPELQVDTGAIVLITSESCEAYPMQCGALYNPDGTPHPDSVFHAFLYVEEAFRWASQTSRNVMGDPLVFPRRH